MKKLISTLFVMLFLLATACAENNPVTVESDNFLFDFAAGLQERWTRANEDTSLFSDKQYIEYMNELIGYEIDAIGKYSDANFEDEQLEEYAHTYLNALNMQYIAVNEYYGKDDVKFSEYFNDGLFSREQMIYWINKKYGLDISKRYEDTFRETVIQGQYIDAWKKVDESMNHQLQDVVLNIQDSSSSSLKIFPFEIKNETSYKIGTLSIEAELFDNFGKQVESCYVLFESDVTPGKVLKSNQLFITEKFDSIRFTYEFSIDSQYYYDLFSGEAAPLIQLSWDKTVVTEDVVEQTATFDIEELTATWQMNSSWSKTLYVPTLKFSVKNTSKVDADKITVKVTFLDTGKKEVWSEERVYVVGSYDSPLHPGYSKKTFVYSSVGFEKKVESVPDITAEVYINDKLMGTYGVSK